VKHITKVYSCLAVTFTVTSPHCSIVPGNAESLVFIAMALSFGELAKNSFCDFFHIPDDYPARIATYKNAQLKKQEATKTRQIYAAFCSIANGAAFAIPSHGGTLVICAWAARRLYVANHKLKYIRAELTLRNLELRAFMHRDWMIPVAVALTGTAIGLGVDFGLHNFVPIGSVSLGSTAVLPTPSGGTAASLVHNVIHVGSSVVPKTSIVTNAMGSIPATHIQEAVAVTQHLHTAAAEGAKGFAEQWQHVFGHGHGPLEDFISSSGDQSLAAAAGFAGGAHAAAAIEHSLAVLIGSQSLQWMSDKLDFESIRPRVSQQLACKRLPWSTAVLCDRCELPIQSGKFFRTSPCNTHAVYQHLLTFVSQKTAATVAMTTSSICVFSVTSRIQDACQRSIN
jgi:hypothetical protein